MRLPRQICQMSIFPPAILLIIGMSAMVSARQARTPIRVTDPAWDSRGPAWSARGDLLAFESHRDGKWGIYTARSDGSEVTGLTSSRPDARYPSWSPDGTAIVYAGMVNATSDLFIVDIKTRVIRQLTNTPEAESFPACWRRRASWPR